MQDRIKELAIEAGFSVEENGAINDGIETAADFSEELTRFAQAIARECAEMVQMKQYRSGRTEIDGVKHGHWPTDLAQQIRARFGIT